MISYVGSIQNVISTKELIKRCGTGEGGRVQVAVDAAVIRYSFPYVPFDEGVLAGSANTGTKIGSGEIVYDTPYARYLWYGEIYGPNFPITENGVVVGFRSPPEKFPTGRKIQYNKDKNHLAGSHWCERAMADHKDDVLKEAQNAANR